MKGQYFILDAECQEEDKLMDETLIYNILVELPQKIGMNTLIEPIIVKGAPHNPGITGVIIMETSNIIIHTFLNPKKLSVDIFSIRNINEGKVVSYLEDQFNFKVIRKNLAERL